MLGERLWGIAQPSGRHSHQVCLACRVLRRTRQAVVSLAYEYLYCLRSVFLVHDHSECALSPQIIFICSSRTRVAIFCCCFQVTAVPSLLGVGLIHILRVSSLHCVYYMVCNKVLSLTTYCSSLGLIHHWPSSQVCCALAPMATQHHMLVWKDALLTMRGVAALRFLLGEYYVRTLQHLLTRRRRGILQSKHIIEVYGHSGLYHARLP